MNSDQKIVIVTRSMQSGGAERVIAQLSNYLVNKAVACTIVTLEDIEVFYDLDTRVKVTAIGSKDRNKIFNKTKQYIAVRNIVKRKNLIWFYHYLKIPEYMFYWHCLEQVFRYMCQNGIIHGLCL